MSRSPRLRAAALACGLATLVAGRASAELPPSPHQMLAPRALVPGLLDAAPVCLPGEDAEELTGVIEGARAGDASGARRRLEATEEAAGSTLPEGDLSLLDAVLALRGASLAEAHQALRGAENALIAGGSDPARACLLLERARVELRLGLLPEARASLERAGRALDPRAMTSPMRETFHFYRAETAIRGGHRDEADALYAELEASSLPILAHAARLRRALHSEVTDDPSSAWKRLENLVDRGAELGLDVDAWAIPVAEAALAAERYEEAGSWLARAEPRLEGGPLTSIRRADVLVELERRDEARRLLERIAATAARAEIQTLVQIRLATAELAPESEQERRARLIRSTAAVHPGVSVYARGELAHRLLAAGEVDGALDQLVRISYDGPTPLHTRHFQADLDRALEEIADRAASDTACPSLVRRLGGRRTLLLAHGSAPRAFLRLGDCYLALEMPNSALDAYRAVSVRFGLEVASALPLRMARGSLRVGDLAAVRAAVRAERAHLAEGSELPTAWRFVAAELAVAEERAGAAIEVLAPLIRSGELDPVRHARALLHLAQLALTTRASGALAETLAASIREAAASAPDEAESLVAEASLYAADLAVRTGSPARARKLYRLAAEGLPPGPLQARAAYRSGLLETSLERSREAFGGGAASEAKSPWARISRAELRLVRLRQAIGRAGIPAR